MCLINLTVSLTPYIAEKGTDEHVAWPRESDTLVRHSIPSVLIGASENVSFSGIHVYL